MKKLNKSMVEVSFIKQDRHSIVKKLHHQYIERVIYQDSDDQKWAKFKGEPLRVVWCKDHYKASL